jgi:LPXTG-motif cell wall-anchored protein
LKAYSSAGISANMQIPVTAGSGSLSSWLAQSTMVSGMSNQSVLLLGGVGILAISLLSKKKKR